MAQPTDGTGANTCKLRFYPTSSLASRIVGALFLIGFSVCSARDLTKYRDPFPQPIDQPLRPIRYRHEIGQLAHQLNLTTGVVLGGGKGRLVEAFLKPWKRAKEYNCVGYTEGYGDVIKQRVRKLGTGVQVKLTQQTPLEAAQKFENGSLGFIYYGLPSSDLEMVVKHVAAWWPKLAKGGIFGGAYPSFPSQLDHPILDFFSDLDRMVTITYRDASSMIPSYLVHKP